ncbi:unannotated protein [freshwater metagenome]|uniref:Unannotated protein n=1 Tax=freshwater metagenome TaxID=449393 RepID=A0A6J7KEG8_9ZZZZ
MTGFGQGLVAGQHRGQGRESDCSGYHQHVCVDRRLTPLGQGDREFNRTAGERHLVNGKAAAATCPDAYGHVAILPPARVQDCAATRHAQP